MMMMTVLYNNTSSVSARSTDAGSLPGRASTAGHQLSVHPTVSVASPPRHVVDKTSLTVANTGQPGLSAVSRPTPPDDLPPLRRPRPGRRASRPPAGVTAVSTWTRNNDDDIRPHTVSRRLAPRRTLLSGGNRSGASIAL